LVTARFTNQPKEDTMTQLRQRMIQDLKLRGFAEKTQQSYVAAVRALAGYYKTSPDLLSQEQVRRFFLYLIDEKKAAKSTVTIHLTGIKFFYERTLGWAASGRQLAMDPLPATAMKLHGTQFTYRIRIGDYRLVYDVLESVLMVEVVRVRHRKDGDRNLP
jgi:hypothetical protein